MQFPWFEFRPSRALVAGVVIGVFLGAFLRTFLG